MKPENFILDVDGVLTTGHFYYSEKGKVLKIFGKDDADALNLLRDFINIHFVSGDKRGFNISKKRVNDMNFDVSLVSTVKRIDWLSQNYDKSKTIYMGDGIFDHYVFKDVFYSIAPKNAHVYARNSCDFQTLSSGGNGAVSEACLHILDKFFEPFDPKKTLDKNKKFSGSWKA